MDPAQEKHIVTPPTKCAVCGLSLTGHPTIVSRTYLGDVFSFCSETCAATFETNPEKFAEDDGSEEDV